MNRLTALSLTLILTLGLAGPATAQSPIGTDRPGLGLNPALVAPGVVQFETGLPSVGLSNAESADVQSYGVPVALRVGLVDRLEFRLGNSPYQRTTTDVDGGPETTADGFGDLEAGLKVGVRDGADGGPSLAFIPAIVLPTGTDEVSTGAPAYSVNATSGWALGSAGLTTVAGLSATPTGSDYQTQGAFVAVLGRELTSSLSGYVEVGAYPTEGADNESYTGGGLALLASPNVQLDAFVLRGLTDVSTDWQFGLGLSARLLP